jgi:hypothetical protein
MEQLELSYTADESQYELYGKNKIFLKLNAHKA